MAIDFEAQAHLTDLRLRVLNGETVSAIEYRDLLLDLRRGRDAAAASQKATTAKARKLLKADKPKPKYDIQKLFSGGTS